MKKLFTLLAIALIGSSVYAQEGSMYIGGMAGFSTQKDTDPGGNEFKSSDWNFSPEIGTWLADDLQLGLSLNISGSNDDADNKTSDFSPAVYVRKWKSVSEKFSIFGGLNVGITSQKIESSGGETKLSGFQAFLDFGAAFAVSDRWGIVGRYATLGFASAKNKDTDAKSTAFGLDVNSLGNPFNIGIYYTFKE